MGYKDREIEVKLLTKSARSMKRVNVFVHNALENQYQCRPIIVGSATDIYWQAPEDSDADFIRLRELDNTDDKGCNSQITLKYSDKGGNINRVEIDVPIGDKAKGAKLLTYLLGDPLGTITKDYVVYFLDDEHTTVSVYQVIKDKRVFVEVEAKTMQRVRQIIDLISGQYEYERVQQSLFELFVLKLGMTTESV